MVTVLAAAALGEVLALIVLYRQRAIPGTGILVLLSAIFLTIAAGIAPTGAFMAIWHRTRKPRTAHEPGVGEKDTLNHGQAGRQPTPNARTESDGHA